MRTLGTYGLRSAAILTYHRVADLELYPYRIVVSPENFRSHLEYIRRTCKPVLFSELVALLKKGRVPPRTVAVTFDDGYADVFTNALPLLQAAGVPATVFVVSGAAGSQTEFWWDEVARLAEAAVAAAHPLSATVGDRHWRWDVAPGMSASALINAMHPELAPLSGPERSAIIDRLFACLGVDRQARADHRAMTIDELTTLALSRGIEIGAHTVSHSALASLSRRQQRDEILGSKEALERLAGAPVRVLSYPFGDEGTISSETETAVAEAGFEAACCSLPGAIRRWRRPFALPRFTVHDSNDREFRRHLNACFWTERCEPSS